MPEPAKDIMFPPVPSREEVTLPWLQEALKAQPFTVLDFRWEGPVGGGVGALSSLQRLSLQVVQKDRVSSLSLVFKTPPSGDNPGLRDFVLNEGFCQREFQIYTKLFPSWKRFQDQRETPAKYRFRYPTCYYAAEEGTGLSYRNVLILEDLLTSGFRSWEKGYRKGLNFPEARKVVKEIAKFHAVGMAFKEHASIQHYTGPEYEYLYTAPKNPELIFSFLSSGIQKTVEFLRASESESPVPPTLIQELEAFDSSSFERVQALSSPLTTKGVGTVAHQDLHIHNVMFGSGGEVALLDFQGLSYSSPMADLTFFLLLSCEPEVFSEKLAEILTLYSESLGEALDAMGAWTLDYPLTQIVADYHSNLLVTLIHIVMGSACWCLGPMTSPDTGRRFKAALLDSYARLGHSLDPEMLVKRESFFAEEEAEE